MELSKDEIIRTAVAAGQALETIEPYFRAVEALYTERLVAITGWRAWWRGDRRRAEAAERIKAVRDVRRAVESVINQGKLAAAPARGQRL
jgi:hypothetical protein